MMIVTEEVLVVTEEQAKDLRGGTDAVGAWRVWTSNLPDFPHQIRVVIPDDGKASDTAHEMRELVLRMIFAMTGENGDIREAGPPNKGIWWRGRYTKTLLADRRRRGEKIDESYD